MLPFIKYTVVMIGLMLMFLGVGSFLLSTYIEQVTMNTIEESLSATFGAPVTVRSVSISPINRSLELKGFALSNPPGFDHDLPALRCEKITLMFNPKTLLTDSPVIRQVHFEKADVYYRHRIGKGTNIKRLSDQASLSAATSGPDSYPRLIVEEVHCSRAKVHFSTNVISKGSAGVNLVDVHLQGLQGNSSNNTRYAAAIFLRSLAREITTLNGVLRPGPEISRDGGFVPGEVPEPSNPLDAIQEFVADVVDDFTPGDEEDGSYVTEGAPAD